MKHGVTEENIDGGIIVNGSWLNIAHSLPLRRVLTAIGWLPGELGADGKNHIVCSSSVVDSVHYGAGRIEYLTFDAPPETIEVLRVSFTPKNPSLFSVESGVPVVLPALKPLTSSPKDLYKLSPPRNSFSGRCPRATIGSIENSDAPQSDHSERAHPSPAS